MSYINDALHKVQKEKESPYASYGDVVSAEANKPGVRRKWGLAAGVIVVLLLMAGLVALLFEPDVRKMPRAETRVQRPDAAMTRFAQNMPPAEVLKTPPPRPAASVEAAVSPPAKVGKTPAAVKALPVEVKDKKQEASPADDPESLFTQALQKQREGRLEEAKELYRQVIKKKPRHIQALNNLGVIYLKLKRYKWAVIRFNDALDIQHNYVDAHYNLACLYAQKNDTKRSLFYLKNAIAYNPEARLWASGDDDFKAFADLPEFNKIVQARDK